MAQAIADDITVVIPTLGHDCVIDTVRVLNLGSLVPCRIILCVPADCHLDLSEFANAELLHVNERGQVLQRSMGFRESRTPYTMQLDDDIKLDTHCLEQLRNSVKDSRNVAIAPAFINSENGKSLYYLGPATALRKLYYWLINGSAGFREGTITRAGTCFGVDSNSEYQQDIVHTDWVPGGCLIHKTENLVTENFFPFTGKAYAEDLIHSVLLQRKGVTLSINLSARAFVEPQPSPALLSIREYLNFVRNEYNARKYLFILAGGSDLRLIAYYICQFVIYFFNKISSLKKNENSAH